MAMAGNDVSDAFSCGNKTVTIRRSDAPGVPIVFLNEFEDDGATVWNACRSPATPGTGGDPLPRCAPFSLVTVSGLAWDRELTPWPASATRAGQADYGGEARDHLRLLTEDVVPRALAALAADSGDGPMLVLAGYSLAGLFATWAAFNTSLFRRTASVSGSLWYPGFVDYVRDHELAPTVERMYFSVGNRERKVPNRTMRSVQDDTIRIRSLVEERGVRTTFDLNSGNHFTGFARRMRKALAWTLRQEDVPGPRGT